jgi:hypothetical protein
MSPEVAGAERIAKGIAVARSLTGVAAMIFPRPLLRMIVPGREPADETVAALRMVGGRDLALGIGGLLAAKRGPHAMRGWVEGGMLADAIDAGSVSTARSLSPAVRTLVCAPAAAASILAGLVARRLTQ